MICVVFLGRVLEKEYDEWVVRSDVEERCGERREVGEVE